MFCNGVPNGDLISLTKGFVIRKDNDNNNSLFLSCQMGLSDGAFFMIKHTPLPNGNHPISLYLLRVLVLLQPSFLNVTILNSENTEKEMVITFMRLLYATFLCINTVFPHIRPSLE